MNPTQVQHPWRAVVRTAIAYIVGAGIVVPLVWDQIHEQMGGYLSAEVTSVILWAVTFIGAVSLTVTRIIAIPQVNGWMTKIGIGAQPAASDDEGEGEGYEPRYAAEVSEE